MYRWLNNDRGTLWILNLIANELSSTTRVRVRSLRSNEKKKQKENEMKKVSRNRSRLHKKGCKIVEKIKTSSKHHTLVADG